MECHFEEEIMMITETPIAYCVECKGSVGYCFCSCPYCGNMTKGCCCNVENSRNSEKNLPDPQHPKHISLKKLKKSSATNPKDNDWWRLEKWQIGRSKFP